MKPEDAKSSSRGISRDMSPEAIAERLRIAGELYELAQTLSTARYVGPVEPPAQPPGRGGKRVQDPFPNGKGV